MKYPMFCPIVFFGASFFLSGSFVDPVFAQLALYEVEDGLVRPDIYTISDLVRVKDLEAMKDDLTGTDPSVAKGYLVGDLSADDSLSEYSGRAVPGMSFYKINDTRYLVKIDRMTDDFVLVLNQRFHNAWSVRLLDNREPSFSSCDTARLSEIFSVRECRSDMRIDYWDTMGNFFRPTWMDAYHFRINDFNNAWLIPYEGQESFVISVDFDIQKNALLGHTISGLTVISCMSILLIPWIRKKISKKNESLS